MFYFAVPVTIAIFSVALLLVSDTDPMFEVPCLTAISLKSLQPSFEGLLEDSEHTGLKANCMCEPHTLTPLISCVCGSHRCPQGLAWHGSDHSGNIFVSHKVGATDPLKYSTKSFQRIPTSKYNTWILRLPI